MRGPVQRASLQARPAWRWMKGGLERIVGSALMAVLSLVPLSPAKHGMLISCCSWAI